MKTRRISVLTLILWATVVPGTVIGQTFSSGSTGADGAYNPTCSPTPCTVSETVTASGIYNYTTVTVPAGVTVRYVRGAVNVPVTVLATGDVSISGAINVSGNNGLASNNGTVVNPGGLGGPGGFNGGNGGVVNGVRATAGVGPGGGQPQCCGTQGNADGGDYGVPPSITFVNLIPLFGGSGGGGGLDTGTHSAGGSGAGGGGAIVIASSTRIAIAGAIIADGGTPGGGTQSFENVGSGGAIRLVAPEITGAGSLLARRGAGGPIASGTNGRIRIEAFNLGFTGASIPTASQSVAPGPVTSASNPALVNLPTLAIGTVGGVAVPSTPGGLYSVADVSLQQGTANPVPVVVTATNTPVPASLFLRVVSQSGGGVSTITIPTGSHIGTFASSQAAINVTFPTGQISLVQAWAAMTLTGQVASLFPLIDGEPVERLMVATAQGQPSTLSVVTKSGKEVRVDQLPFADQLRVALAWGAMGQARVE